ncbi:aspartic peptidase domain-containing protein [Obelidium mucronatum]|nr:aspartic peptidase domain-containing protein [Obelidium mucronatum]
MVGSAPLDPNTVEAQVPQTQYPHIQTEYRAQIYIGTPPKLFNILLDTGSYDLWVFGRGCDCGAIQHSYHVNASSTGEDLNVRAPSVTYADGSKYTGFRVKDTVRMGPLAVSAFQFTQVETFSSPWNPDNSSDADGIMGMGFHPTGLVSLCNLFHL